MNNFAQFMNKKYVEWQAELGKRKTLEEFAAYIGVSRPLLSMWMNGTHKPGHENSKILIEIFGIETYDALELPRPNPLLQAINARWERIPPDKQQKLLELSEQFEIKNDEQRLQETSKQRKKAPRK